LGSFFVSLKQVLSPFPDSLELLDAIPNRHGLIEFACLSIGSQQRFQVRNEFVLEGLDFGGGSLPDRFRLRLKFLRGSRRT